MNLDQAGRKALAVRMGHSLGQTTAPAGAISATAALTQLQDRYEQLSVQGAKLRALGSVVPCKIRTDYTLALKNYFLSGVDLIRQLEKQGGTVAQVVYKDGQPLKDASGNLIFQQVSAPLLPPLVGFGTTDCPSLRQQGLAGALHRAQLGQAQLAAPILRLIVLIAGSIAASVVLDKINVALHGWNTTPDQKVDAFTNCVDQLQAKGIAPADAVRQCGGIVPGSGQGLGALGWIGLFSLVIVGAGTAAYFVFRKTSTGERERKQRILEAEEAAERAAEEATQARSRARAVRAGRLQPA